MIEQSHEAVRNQRRVMRVLYTKSDEQKELLRRKPRGEVFSQTYLYNHKDFWNTWCNHGINDHLKTIKFMAKQMGAYTVGELLTMDFDELRTLPAADIRSLAMLCDFATAFGLDFPGAPEPIPTPPQSQAVN